jgi:putative hemolysin
MAYEIIFIILLIIANGIFAMSEIAIISARKAKLQQLVNEGNTKAKIALELANSPNRFLSTIQIGITLIGIFAGALGGATIAEELKTFIYSIPILEILRPYSDSIAITIVVLGITYTSLVIGELVPKRLAMHNTEKIACMVANPMRTMSVIMSPAVHLLSSSTDIILKIIGIKPIGEHSISEDEIKILIDEGIKAGTFEIAERDMIEHIFRLSDQRVSALLTPRNDIVWLDVDDSPDEIRRKMVDSGLSRFPLCQNSLDNILGIIQVKDILSRGILCKDVSCKDIIEEIKKSLRRPLFVPDNTHVLKVLELFKQSGIHMSIVVDEYGSVQGLITLNDILEEIVGDIPTAEELADPEAVKREDGSWLLGGMLPVDKFKEIFHITKLPGEGNYHTLAGFVLAQMGRIPSVGNHFEWSGLRFEVVDMDKNRIDKMLVMRAMRTTAKEFK